MRVPNIRWYIDPETDEPHIYRHGVTKQEVEEVLARAIEDRPGEKGSRIATGPTAAGRLLKVIYCPDASPDSIFVITSYPPSPKAAKALRRRQKRS